MAKTDGSTHQPLLPQLRQDSKRALKRPMPIHPINKAQSIGKNHGKQDSWDHDRGQRLAILSYPNHQKTHEAFFHIEHLTKSIHTDQTGAFPFTSQ